MNDTGGAERRSVATSGKEITIHFEMLAMHIQEAIDRLPSDPASAKMRENLEAAKAAAERGIELGRELPEA